MPTTGLPHNPRSSNYMGMRSDPHVAADGSWLEPEELCYPHGRAYSRRCYARCEDGIFRVVECGIPDTYFSIPARARMHGPKWTKGFVTSDEQGYKFIASAKQD